ncbi:MAG TPA: sugar phosphate nucleotidyltransferase [Thermoanaerobaculia bacterium]|nr:sugar phosphate nucleotidyltransferase [Thermoanaerobaculia bacterium]
MTRGATRDGATGARRPAHAIVLAAGSGERLRPVTERWLGERRPKQYCTFVGTRSMLQHTLDRVKTVVPRRNIVTVIAEEHERYLASAVPAPFPGTLVRQPSNRGTAVGVFLPLAYVLERDPNATVMVFPCDHFIYPEGRFLQYVMASYRLCRGLDDSLLLLAVPATSAETDYGWIEAAAPRPGSPIAPLRPIERLIEKPSLEDAATLLRRGGLWNTMVVAARANTLWELGRKFLPDVIEAFDDLRQSLRSTVGRAGLAVDGEARILRDAYDRLRAADFSADFLARAVDSTLVFPLEDLLWSDWGRPKRVMHSIQELGLQTPSGLARAF